MSGFDSAYLGTPPWDIGSPQPEARERKTPAQFLILDSQIIRS